MINISKQELNFLYNKAKERYYKCIKDSDNVFLEEELLVPLDSIKLRFLSIKIVFSQDISERYELEISLGLWTESSIQIGKYLYIENDKGNAIDDSLVFF